MPEEIVFKPKYKKEIISGFVWVAIITPLMWVLPLGNSMIMLGCKAYMLFFLLWLPFVTIKRIILSDKIIMERFFLPSKIFRYEDIKEISIAVYFSNGAINVRTMKNGDEFMLALAQRMKEVNFNMATLTYRNVEKYMKSLNYAAIVMIPLFIITLIFKVRELAKDGDLKLFLIFITVCGLLWGIVELVKKRR